MLTTFILTSLLVALPSINPQSGNINFKQISEHVSVIRLDFADGWSSNMTVIEADESIIVIDTFVDIIASNTARHLILDRFEKPIKYLFNTHYHQDHTSGNQIFRDATIIAHANCIEPMKEDNEKRQRRIRDMKAELKDMEAKLGLVQNSDGPEGNALKEKIAKLKDRINAAEMFKLTLPNRTIHGSQSIKIEDIRLTIKYYPMAHTNADLVFLIENDGVIVTGDVVRNRVIPSWHIESGATIQHHISALDNLLTYSEKYSSIVPGNGLVADFAVVEEQRDYLLKLLSAVKVSRSGEMTLQETITRTMLSEFSHWLGYDGGREASIEAVWNMLEKK